MQQSLVQAKETRGKAKKKSVIDLIKESVLMVKIVDTSTDVPSKTGLGPWSTIRYGVFVKSCHQSKDADGIFCLGKRCRQQVLPRTHDCAIMTTMLPHNYAGS